MLQLQSQVGADPLKTKRRTDIADYRLLKPGHNCWRLNQADRLAYLVDGQSFFTAFRQAALKAEHSIFIVGWDIHSGFELVRESEDDGFPSRLGEFLDALARSREDLDIRILTWDFAMILAPHREWASRYRLGWQTHEHVQFAFDSRHPTGGSQHQKVVVIDDRVAFVGGLDFTRGRWDTTEHMPEDPRRADYPGHRPRPYHDVQVIVTGDVAADLGELARQRWQWATGESPPEAHAAPDGGAQAWPVDLEPELEDTPVAIARTLPELDGREAIREVEHLLVDAIGSARQHIYIENQYFTAPCLSDPLAERLGEEDGPEVVMVLPRETVGWLSQFTMDVLRDRRLRQLQNADRYGRLRIWYPDRPDLGKACINVHSKVLVVDDDFMCAGSANFNNRSLGLDSECNLAVEAAGDEARRKGIARLRDRLLAEHLDVSRAEVAEAIDREGSLIGAIERLQRPGRSLRALQPELSDAVDASVPETAIADPEQAIDGEYIASQLIPREDKKTAQHGLLGLAALILLALLLAAAWRWTPLGEWLDPDAVLERVSSLSGSWLAPLVVAGVYIVGGFLMIPVTLMIVATGLAFGAVYGFSYALLGAELSALVSYGVGHLVGHHAISHLSNRWVARASRFLGRQGLLAIITLRIVPVAPFTVVNVVAGASHIRFRDFALGTLLGMVPGTFALAVLSDRVVAAIQSPDVARIAVVVAVVLLAGLGTWALGRWLKRQQDARR